MTIRKTRIIGSPTIAKSKTRLEKYRVVMVVRFDAANTPDASFSIRSTTFQELIRSGPFTGGPVNYPKPAWTRVDAESWVVTKVAYTYGIRPGGGLSKGDEVFQVRASAGTDPFTMNLFTIPFTSSPCPPGETRTYTYTDPIAFNIDSDLQRNTGFLIASSGSGIFEYSYEQLVVDLWAVNPRPRP